MSVYISRCVCGDVQFLKNPNEIRANRRYDEFDI